MEQNEYLTLSKFGKTVIKCQKDYEGAVVIPDGVTKIGQEAFSDCTRLASIKIPNSVTKIGKSAFSFCTSLAELHLRHKEPIDLRDAFYFGLDLSKITIFVPEGSDAAYRQDPFYSKFKEVVIER